MKTKSKALLLTLCAVLLVAASVLGTMAYLTDKETVTNTFTVGKVKITLDEAKVNTNGEPVNASSIKVDKVEDAPRVGENTYKLMPGHEYVKDPTVHVDIDSEESYVFVKVENGIEAYEAATSDAEGGYKKIAEQITGNGWTALADVENVYYKKYKKNTVGNDLKVFENFKIADNADSVKDWGTLTDAKVIVTAYAIQADGFANANAAWTAGGFGNTTTNP